jgi:hypothetical protein
MSASPWAPKCGAQGRPGSISDRAPSKLAVGFYRQRGGARVSGAAAPDLALRMGVPHFARFMR